MTGPDIQTGSSDVAMFIDWENMHGFIRGKANISALREVAKSYGRLGHFTIGRNDKEVDYASLERNRTNNG